MSSKSIVIISSCRPTVTKLLRFFETQCMVGENVLIGPAYSLLLVTSYCLSKLSQPMAVKA